MMDNIIGLTQIDYYISGADELNYNVPDSTFLPAVPQGFLNFTGYPLPSGIVIHSSTSVTQVY